MGKSQPFHKIADISRFGNRRFQKFLSGRRVVEKIPHQKGGAFRGADFFQALFCSAFNAVTDACKASRCFVISSTWETAAMLERASPRNPRVPAVRRSSTERILLVAWRRKAALTCSGTIPLPLSVIRIREIPPSRISTVTALAPASMAFSHQLLYHGRGPFHQPLPQRFCQ